LSDAIRIFIFLKQLGDSQFQRGRGKKKKKIKGKKEKEKKVCDLNYIFEQVMKLTLQNLKF
jgi:hypothetical protein